MGIQEPKDKTYARARIAGALLLIGVVCVLAVIDSLNTAFTMDPIELGLLVGTASILLGVEALDRRIK